MLGTDGVLGPVSMIDLRALQRARHGENIGVVLQLNLNSFSSVTTNKPKHFPMQDICVARTVVYLLDVFGLKSSCLDISSAVHGVTCSLLNAPLRNTFKHPQLVGAQ